MCVARLVMQQWRDEFSILLKEANIKEKISKIYVDDNRCIVERFMRGMRFDESQMKFVYKDEWKEEDERRDDDERIAEEILKAMNAINEDLEFTIEKESDFENKRLPTLGFELWSTKERLRHSYYEKGMRSQVLTEKRSSQSENQKFAILTNELHRRLQMMDDWIETEEQIEKIDHFTQQLINSGYQWGQIREVVVSSLKGFLKKEMRRREKEEERRYRRGDETLESRLKKKLIENVQWYKEDNSKQKDELDGETVKHEVDNQKWKPWRRRKKQTKQRQKEMSDERKKEEGVEREIEYVRGVFFIPHTENSELAKRIREKLRAFEEVSRIRVKLVERTGEKLVDIIHKSNPWEAIHCQRDDCIF